MAKKGKKRGGKPHGHFCKVCGEHKANEKFSGKGHAAHICKSCMALSAAERSEMMAIRKIEGMAFRYLSEGEIKWLRGKMNDERDEVREAAIETHHAKFPGYGRRMAKKGLTARALDFFIHGDIWDEYGDEIFVHTRFLADNTGAVRRIDYTLPEHERETMVQIGQPQALKFLKSVVQQLNAPFWGEDLNDGGPEADPYLDILPGWDMDDGIGDVPESPAADENREPVCELHITLNKGGKRDILFYHDIHDEPVELFWALSSWFEPDADEFGEEEINGI